MLARYMLWTKICVSDAHSDIHYLLYVGPTHDLGTQLDHESNMKQVISTALNCRPRRRPPSATTLISPPSATLVAFYPQCVVRTSYNRVARTFTLSKRRQTFVNATNLILIAPVRYIRIPRYVIFVSGDSQPVG